MTDIQYKTGYSMSTEQVAYRLAESRHKSSEISSSINQGTPDQVYVETGESKTVLEYHK